MTNDRTKALRASFDDVLSSQRKLRKKLHELIKKNKPIENFEEEEKFRELLDQAAVGLERNVDVVIKTTGTATRKPPNADKKTKGTFTVFRGTLSKLIMAALKMDDSEFEPVSSGKETPYTAGKRLKDTIKIKRFWAEILEKLESVAFPAARELVFQSSPERLAQEKQRARSDW